MATRKLKFDGFLMSTPAVATVTVNGISVFDGEVGVGKPLDQPVELCVVEYIGSNVDAESITIEVTVSNGVIKVGTIWNDAPMVMPPWAWFNDDEINDGRSNILINGEPPDWPLLTVEPQPLGTEENPGWAGWCFEVSAGDTFSCNYKTINWAQYYDPDLLSP